MTTTSTATETYTRADVQKVFEKFRSDYRMAARSTELISDDAATSTADDVSDYAAAGFVTAVHIVLRRANGTILQAEEYQVTEQASSLSGSRPGGCLWKPAPGGSLGVFLVLNESWHAQTEQQRATFYAKLRGHWGPSNFDTTYPGLVRVANRDYVSNAYGLRRSSISSSGA